MEVAANDAPQPEGAAPPPADRKRRSLPVSGTALIALAITAVVVIATVVILLAGNQTAATYPADSPEGSLQRYVAAWFDEDYDTAYTYFSTRVKAQMSLEEFRREAGFGYTPDSQSVELDSSTGTDPRRTLNITVEDYFGYGGEGYRHQESVSMVLEPDGWRVDESLIGLQPYYGSKEF